MSAINGDKARFNRDRKSKIARRARKRERFANMKEQSSSKTGAVRPARVSA